MLFRIVHDNDENSEDINQKRTHDMSRINNHQQKESLPKKAEYNKNCTYDLFNKKAF